MYLAIAVQAATLILATVSGNLGWSPVEAIILGHLSSKAHCTTNPNTALSLRETTLWKKSFKITSNMFESNLKPSNPISWTGRMSPMVKLLSRRISWKISLHSRFRDLRKKKSTGENGFRVSAAETSKKKGHRATRNKFLNNWLNSRRVEVENIQKFRKPSHIHWKKNLKLSTESFVWKNPVKKHQFDTQTRCYLNIPRLFRS